LRWANQFGDQVEIIVTIAKYTSSFGFYARKSHLEGEKMFTSTKCKVDLPPWLEVVLQP
jgi:hypothetical protein